MKPTELAEDYIAALTDKIDNLELIVEELNVEIQELYDKNDRLIDLINDLHKVAISIKLKAPEVYS